jgi:hypothetical protein
MLNEFTNEFNKKTNILEKLKCNWLLIIGFFIAFPASVLKRGLFNRDGMFEFEIAGGFLFWVAILDVVGLIQLSGN